MLNNYKYHENFCINHITVFKIIFYLSNVLLFLTHTYLATLLSSELHLCDKFENAHCINSKLAIIMILYGKNDNIILLCFFQLVTFIIHIYKLILWKLFITYYIEYFARSSIAVWEEIGKTYCSQIKMCNCFNAPIRRMQSLHRFPPHKSIKPKWALSLFHCFCQFAELCCHLYLLRQERQNIKILGTFLYISYTYFLAA